MKFRTKISEIDQFSNQISGKALPHLRNDSAFLFLSLVITNSSRALQSSFFI